MGGPRRESAVGKRGKPLRSFDPRRLIIFLLPLLAKRMRGPGRRAGGREAPPSVITQTEESQVPGLRRSPRRRRRNSRFRMGTGLRAWESQRVCATLADLRRIADSRGPRHWNARPPATLQKPDIPSPFRKGNLRSPPFHTHKAEMMDPFHPRQETREKRKKYCQVPQMSVHSEILRCLGVQRIDSLRVRGATLWKRKPVGNHGSLCSLAG